MKFETDCKRCESTTQARGRRAAERPEETRGGAMRTIGNIERFLVIGIVVVIGAILAVAIKGADDLEGAYKK